jgi:hypothetical protein
MNAFDNYLLKKANNFDKMNADATSGNAEVIEVNDDDSNHDVMFLNESKSSSSNDIPRQTNNRKRNFAQSGEC